MVVKRCFILIFLNLLISINCIEEKPSIIVIGAGMSGIAAAAALWRYNFTNLKILEAEDYIGGRIRNATLCDAYVDSGAQFCQEKMENFGFEIIKQYNTMPRRRTVKTLYSNGGGTQLHPEFMNFVRFMRPVCSRDDRLREHMWRVRIARQRHTEIDESPLKEPCYNVSSMGECLPKQLKSKLVEKYYGDDVKFALDSVDWLESYFMGDYSVFSLHDLSRIKSNNACYYLDTRWRWPVCKEIINSMLRKFHSPTQELPVVELNKEVAKIVWSNSTEKNYVRCSDNTEYEADHIIFTPSLGVLKADHDKIFEPGLPDQKVEAINSAGFGAMMEIILHFPTIWWERQGVCSYNFIWSAEDTAKILTEFGRGPIKNGKSWLTTSAGVITAKNNSNILRMFFGGEMVPELEKESDAVLRDGCMYMLKKFLGGKYSIVQPDKMKKSTWHSNPHFRGTNSYDSVKNNIAEDRFKEELATPLYRENGKPSVLFAGEATDRNRFSTAIGAVESGYREAARIIKLYTNASIGKQLLYHFHNIHNSNTNY